ncbi:MAG TPA: GFA family protein [Steroidobacteraceae bacterium]|nr:GFA family protein [Steroidobacteraceae bacterium]
MVSVITGGCLCKAVRYRVTAAPIVTRVCWCRLCQYLGAGSGTVNTCFPSNAMTIEGELADFSVTADSGNTMHRRFCPKCGTQMFSEAESRPHLIFVRAGTLDDPEVARPAMTIWTSQAPSWACLSESLPRIERQPPPAA